MTIAQWLSDARARLEKSGCPDPVVDSRWIAEDVLGLTAPALRFEGAQAIAPDKLSKLEELLTRREVGEPVQYILNRCDFMGLDFFVDRRVLIPRQDTETLVESAVVALQGARDARVLDLCCGSGAIGLSIKSLCPHAEVTLSDISQGALEVSKLNAKRLDLEADLRHGDLFEAVRGEYFDYIVSNPPYIPDADMDELQREVGFEPELALRGGADGLDFYRRIADGVGDHLASGGSLYLEVGAGEAKAVLELLRGALRLEDSGIERDLNGIERVVRARRM